MKTQLRISSRNNAMIYGSAAGYVLNLALAPSSQEHRELLSDRVNALLPKIAAAEQRCPSGVSRIRILFNKSERSQNKNAPSPGRSKVAQ